MAAEYHLERADTAGARFTIDRGERYTIRVTLRDDRVLPLGGNTSEPARDEQLAALRRCVTLPPD